MQLHTTNSKTPERLTTHNYTKQMLEKWTSRMSLFKVLFLMRFLHQALPSFIGHTLPTLIWNHVIIQMHRRAQRRFWLLRKTPDTWTRTICHPIHFLIGRKRLSSGSVAAEPVKLAMLPLPARVDACRPIKHADLGACVTAKTNVGKFRKCTTNTK